MIHRYSIALAQGRSVYERLFEEDRRLLDGLGLGLLSVDNTVRVVVKKKLRGDKINAWDVTEIGPSTWEWLHPLLVELQERRAAAGATTPNAVRVATGVFAAK